MACISANPSVEDMHDQLTQLAKEIASSLSGMDSTRSKELLSDFVSELFLAVANQRSKEERLQKQAEGIAAAKARGVRFGRTAKPLPDNFDEVYRAWCDGQMSLKQAADACGIAKGTFYNIVTRKQQAKNCAV